MKYFQYSIFVTSFIGCVGTEPAIKTYNAEPTFQIQSHGDGHIFEEGENIQFYGIASDTNNLPEDLLVSWYSDQEMLCDWTTPDPSGVVRCDVVISDAYSRISAQVVDTFQASSRDEIEIVVQQGSAPLASIISPNDGDLFFQGEDASSITFVGQVNDLEEPSSDLEIIWTSSLDGELDLELTVTESGEISDSLSADNLSLGNHVLTLQATDKTGKIGTSRVEFQVLPQNQRPTCEILSPNDLDVISANEALILSGVALDEDQLSESLNIVWTSDIDGELGVSTADSQGDFLLPLEGLSIGNHNITLTVTDQYGLECSDQVLITLNVPPELTLIEPATGSRFNIGELVTFELTIQDQEDPASTIPTTITSSADGVLTTQYPDSDGSIIFSTATLSAGQHSISITSIDSAELSSVANMQLYMNTPPETPSVFISPPTADTTSDLSASIITPNDVDGDTVSIEFEWYKNEVFYSDIAISISSLETQKGDVWTLQAIATDGLASSAMVSQSIVIQNALPQIDSIDVSSTSPNLGDTLTCTATASDLDDVDQGNLQISYLWKDADGNDLSEDQSIIVNQIVAQAGEIYCHVSVSDGSNVSTGVSEVVLFPNLPPQITSVSIDGNLVNDASLQCIATATDPDNDDLVYGYVWKNQSTNQILPSTLSSITLSPSMASPMDNISCEVTVTDTYGFDDVDEYIVSINNRSPSISIMLSPTDAIVGEIVSCVVDAEDIDGDILNIDIDWYKQDGSGNQQTLGSSELLSLTSVTAGDQVYCEATATDAYNASVSETQSFIVGSAGPVFISNAFVEPVGSKFNDSELTCSGEAYADGASIIYTYKWFNDNNSASAIIGNQSTLALDASFAQPNDIIRCEITARNLNDNTTSTSQTSLTLSNRPPTFSSPISLPETIYNTDTISCDTQIEDLDDPNNSHVQISYEWYINDEPTNFDSSEIELSSDVIQPEDVLTCTILVDDGIANTISDSIDTIIENREGTIQSIVIDVVNQSDDSFAYNDDELRCVVVAEDPDNTSTPNISYSWKRNRDGSLDTIGNNTESLTLLPSDVRPSDEITCVAEVDSSSVEASILIENRELLETPTVFISPENPTSADVLTCSHSEIQDPDAQVVEMNYRWYKNQTIVQEAMESTFSDIVQNDVVSCMIEFTESHTGALPLQISSVEVTIASSPPIVSNIQFNPSTPTTSTDIIVSFDLSDPDGDSNLTVDYAWFVNDIEISNDVDALQTDVIPLSEVHFAKDDVITFEITPKDTDSVGEKYSLNITIANTSPTPSNVNITPSSPVGGVDDLLCSYDASVDPDATDGEDVLNYTQIWVDENDTEYESDTISSSLTEEDQIWTCKVFVSDGTDTTESEASIQILSPCPLGSCTQTDEFTMEDGQVFNATFKYILGGEEPLEAYVLSDFYMMETEVTQEFYDGIVGIDSAYPPSILGDNYPIDNVNWHNMAYLANRLTQLYNASYGTSLQECYSCASSESCSINFLEEEIYLCTGFRLPTEWEWEYAARSGTNMDIWTGFTSSLGANIPNASNITILEHSDPNLQIDISDYAYNCQDAGSTSPTQTTVASLLPNGFGLYDMHGNVAEWTHEITGMSYNYSNTRPSLNSDNPFTYSIGSNANKSIIRGGRCNDDQIYLSASNRKTWTITSNRPLSGGRLVRGNLSP